MKMVFQTTRRFKMKKFFKSLTKQYKRIKLNKTILKPKSKNIIRRTRLSGKNHSESVGLCKVKRPKNKKETKGVKLSKNSKKITKNTSKAKS